MPARHIRTISLSPELDRFISDEISSGLYASASEVVRAGLRQLRNAKHPGMTGQDQPSNGRRTDDR